MIPTAVAIHDVQAYLRTRTTLPIDHITNHNTNDNNKKSDITITLQPTTVYNVDQDSEYKP